MLEACRDRPLGIAAHCSISPSHGEFVLMTAARTLDVAIIGAGLSGLYAVHRMRERGLRVRAFERAGDVGGTWWWNNYPGARVDAPGGPFYCYTFSQRLVREWNWAETRPDQPAILDYLSYVADTLELRKDIQLNTDVTAARFDETFGQWELSTSSGERIWAHYLVTAMGTLSRSYQPDITGISSFGGEAYHTGQWPKHTDVSFSGKRVGVIGTGSSGVQIIPVIAETAAELTVFQRTPQYVLPARNRALDPDLAQAAKNDWPRFRRAFRETGEAFPVVRGSALDDTIEVRYEKYEAAWLEGGFAARELYNDHLTDRLANQCISDYVRSKIREIVRDACVADRLMPDFYFGTKRLILGTNYYESYNRSNVKLVDLREEPITAVTPSGVRTSATAYPLDMLVFATGYDAMTGALLGLDPVGRKGISLRKRWASGTSTYLGLTISGFPNLMMIHGPQTPSVKYHMQLGAELQVEWIIDCIEHMREHGFTTVDVCTEYEEKWSEEVREVLEPTLFSLTDSWYMGANIPGKPREFLIYLDGPRYHDRISEVSRTGYQGFVFDSPGGGVE